MTDNSLADVRVLMVIAPCDFRDEELFEPQAILKQHGAHVTVACTKPGQATGMLGATVTPDTTIDKVMANDYQAVIIVGGMGAPTYLWDNGHVHTLLRDVNKSGRIVAGICLSAAVLARAGVLRHRKATVWATPESVKALQDGGANYMKEHVVHDANAITADGPESATEFGTVLVEALQHRIARV